MSVIENSEFLWNFVQERTIDKLNINIQHNPQYIDLFKEILQTTYNNSFKEKMETVE